MTSVHPAQPGIPRLVIDPGVWISALIGKAGAPDELLEAATEGRIVVLVSPMLLAELQEVISRPKFRSYFSIEQGRAFAAALTLLAQTMDDPAREGWTPVCRDPDDDYLIALTEASEATMLVSGDLDLLSLHRPGLDVRLARSAVEAITYRHPWGTAVVPGTLQAALAQADAEGHGPVLATAIALLQILGDEAAKERFVGPGDTGITGSLETQLGGGARPDGRSGRFLLA